jgi:hypothetical protein
MVLPDVHCYKGFQSKNEVPYSPKISNGKPALLFCPRNARRNTSTKKLVAFRVFGGLRLVRNEGSRFDLEI